MLGQSSGVITDSGGIQEEVPSVKIPLYGSQGKNRKNTGFQNGWSVLAGQTKELFPDLNGLKVGKIQKAKSVWW